MKAEGRVLLFLELGDPFIKLVGLANQVLDGAGGGHGEPFKMRADGGRRQQARGRKRTV